MSTELPDGLKKLMSSKEWTEEFKSIIKFVLNDNAQQKLQIDEMRRKFMNLAYVLAVMTILKFLTSLPSVYRFSVPLLQKVCSRIKHWLLLAIGARVVKARGVYEFPYKGIFIFALCFFGAIIKIWK